MDARIMYIAAATRSYRSYNSRNDATNAPSTIALASIFASKNHIDVTARMTIDKTWNLYEINIKMIFVIELFKQYSFLDVYGEKEPKID